MVEDIEALVEALVESEFARCWQDLRAAAAY
jgi:hypothetical protein